MSGIDVTLRFSRTFDGTLEAARGSLAFSDTEQGAFKPYDLMLGALGSCYYHTFVGIADKMRLEYEKAEIHINGVKREETPATLKTVVMTFTVHGAKDQKGFQRAAELAAKYCSVHETIKQVADITLQVVFA